MTIVDAVNCRMHFGKMSGLEELIVLSRKTLPQIEKRGVRIPRYGPIKSGALTIVHISVGGFHRAHQLLYLDELLSADNHEKWRSLGVGLLPFDMVARDAMKAQDCLYTLVQRDATGNVPRIIGAMPEYFYAPEKGQEVLNALSDPSCKIVSMTITESGYFLKGNGEFDVDNLDIRHDLGSPSSLPRTSFGYLLAALKRRKEANVLPFTILSCDNIQANGQVTKKMLLECAKLFDADLASWLEKYGAFPSCMVDCITPNTSDSHRKLVAHEFGILDKWPVTCETFRQWVIEDHFPLGRPAWETVGVQMVQDVVPYELMKLRLLNGPQFLCGVLGVVLGYRHFPEAMGDASVRRMVRLLMDEVTPFVPPISDIDLEKYKDKLMERFANPALNDQLMRIVHSSSRDGSSKIRQFILPCVRDAIKAGSCFPVTFSAFAVAIWIFYLGQDVDAVGNTLDFTDARQQALHVTAQGCGTDARRFLKMKDIFGDDLADEPRFADEVQIILEKLYEHGARFAVDQHV